MSVPGLGLVGAYLLGAIPTSYLAARIIAHTDLREFGSKNLGATNLYRLLGLKVALPVGLFDVAKGAVPVLLARQYGNPEAGSAWPIVVGLAAVLGHVFSPFVRFKGGKGVATAVGAFLGLTPLAIAVAVAVWIAVVAATRYVSLGSMMAAGSFAFAVPAIYRSQRATAWAALVIFAFIVFTHRANLRRLVSGTESKIGRGGAGGHGPAAPAGPAV